MMLQSNIAAALSAIAFWLLTLADRLAPVLEQRDTELSAQATVSRIALVSQHPCRGCRGSGALMLNNEAMTCPRCFGFKIEPTFLIKTAPLEKAA